MRITSDVVATLIKLLEQNSDIGLIAPFLSDDWIHFEPIGKVHDIPNRNIGGCFLMRRDFFQKIGRFNENFFLWWEDTELRDCVLDNNKRIGFADGIVVAHSGAHSTNPPEHSRRAYLARVWLSSHAFYLIERKGVLVALLWCISMLSYNLLQIFTGRVSPRLYHYQQTAFIFGLHLLANSYRLRKFVIFDGQGYLWNRYGLA